MQDAVFRSVKRVCYAGLDSVTLRQELANRVERVVHFDAHAFGTADPDTGLLTHVVAHGLPVSLFVTYSNWLYPMKAAVETIDAARLGKTFIRLEEDAPEIQEAMRASGLHDAAHLLLTLDGTLWGKWCMMRASGRFETTRGELTLLERIAPHVARGLRAAALIDEGMLPGPPTSATPGILVVDPAGRPTLRTPALAPMLDDLADVGIAPPVPVPLSILNMVRDLRIRLGSAQRDDVPAEATLRARGQSGRWYVMRASLAEPDRNGDAASVVVVRPAAPREMAPILSRLYGLSQREREVAAALARGDSTKRIAARFGISPHTVKEHVERACDKIGVSGRRALVARLYFDAYAPSADGAALRSSRAAVPASVG